MPLGLRMQQPGKPAPSHYSPPTPNPGLTLLLIQFQRWEAIAAIDIVTDVALFLVSILLVKDLQMSWQPKAIVVAAFGTRLL
jgi:hypothetical protein